MRIGQPVGLGIGQVANPVLPYRPTWIVLAVNSYSTSDNPTIRLVEAALVDAHFTRIAPTLSGRATVLGAGPSPFDSPIGAW